MVALFGKGEKSMPEEFLEIISDLESLQYDILFWKRKEEDETKKQMLADYDDWIERVIDKVYALPK